MRYSISGQSSGNPARSALVGQSGASADFCNESRVLEETRVNHGDYEAIDEGKEKMGDGAELTLERGCGEVGPQLLGDFLEAGILAPWVGQAAGGIGVEQFNIAGDVVAAAERRYRRDVDPVPDAEK